MAERRMFAKTIIDSDAFLDMPISAQGLYFHLSMRADDEGFINNYKKIMRMVGSTDDDLKILIAKRFLIVFESGVIVIKHWKLHNYIQSDRFKPTVYQEEREMLTVKENKAYTLEALENTQCIQNGYNLDTQVRLGKDRLDKDSIGEDSIERPHKRFTPPSIEEVESYMQESGYHIDAERFIDYYEANGWKVGKNAMKDWKATVRNWARKDCIPMKAEAEKRERIAKAREDYERRVALIEAEAEQEIADAKEEWGSVADAVGQLVAHMKM